MGDFEYKGVNMQSTNYRMSVSDDTADRVYVAIERFIAKHGCSPSLQELSAICKISTELARSATFRLVEQGRVLRGPKHSRRSLSLVVKP